MVAQRHASDESVGFLVAMIRRRLNLKYSEALRPLGLTTRQYGVLSLLWRHDGLTVETLTAELYTDQSSLSRVLDRMVKAALITRRPDLDDRRARRISLTKKGRALERPVARMVGAIERCLTRRLLPSEVSRIQSDLKNLLGNLNEVGA